MDIDDPQPERETEPLLDAETGGGGDEDRSEGSELPEAADAPADTGDPHTALPPKVEAWRKRSAAGAILTGFALGLQQALETHREEPSIVVQTSGDLPDDLPVEADFEYGRPRQSVVSIRPWLLNNRAEKPAGPEADTAEGAEPPEGS